MLSRIRRDERGVAMITALLVAAVLTALGLTVTQVAFSNMTNAGRDRVASGALGAAEAGVTRAIAYINKNNTHALNCSPNCATNPWGSSANPQTISLPDGRTAKVYIKQIQEYAPPAYKVGTYKIYSVGTAGAVPGQRTLEVTVEVKPLAFPLGIFTHDKINNGGTSSVTSESVLSDSCVDNRSHINFTGTDAYYGIPAAAHSTQYITEANLQACDPSLTNVKANDRNAIHRSSTCSSTYPYDQDGAPLGGAFPLGSSCTTAAGQYTSSSLFTMQMLTNDPYNFLPRGLTDAQYALLKARAQANGTYYTTPTPPSWPVASSVSNPVLYFKLSPGQEVNLQGDLNTFAWSNDPTCALQHPAVVIVVEGGDLHINSNASLSGAVFVPDGTLTYNGGAVLIGTVFTKSLVMTGNANISLNDCYTRGTPGGVLDVRPVRFREVDR
jgi:uncharacterized protein (UPF0333 family)